jgi:hypothetical protein
VKAFIILRDRVTYAHLCVTAMTEAVLDAVIVDHGSTWPLALDWLTAMEAAGVTVLRRGPGWHPRSLWGWDVFREMCGEGRYVVTDCDVVPGDDCPPDWPQKLLGLLDEYPEYDKAGLGLRLDRIPESYTGRDHVLEWEGQYWRDQLADGVYRAPVDTTLAMYRTWRERPYFGLHALRTGYPYVADHLAWYEDYAHLADELRYYHEHAEPGISYWTVEGRSAWDTA